MPGFIIDLDGTVYAGTNSIPHVDTFLQSIRREGWPYLFLTNNSTVYPHEVADRLHRLTGLATSGGDVLTSAMATARFIRERGDGRRVFCIGEAGLKHTLAEAGLELTSSAPDYVVQGIDREFTYAKLSEAVSHIRAGAVFIQTNPDHLLPLEHGPVPGSGSIGAAIRTASETEPIVIGKPSPIITHYGIRHIGLPPEEIWMVGDNIRTDIGAGIAAGCRTALALTGLATPANYEALIDNTGIHPDLCVHHLMELYEKLR
ncbi:MAG: family hydrolase [Paenibacillaceae bacterium]|jgi:4-nitrophenyl phosphatase|nr:family hydrolase [Paenibacillaceae bacterium]